MGYDDHPARSPWIAQLAPDGPPTPLDSDATVDTVVIGAGIAGMAASFFTLRSTDHRVLLIERGRVARGATGRNAGQLTTYFEKPLTAIAAEFGDRLACEAQDSLDNAHDLLDLMVAESGARVRVERFMGRMGMFNLNHLQVHLGIKELRQRGGIRDVSIVVSEDAEFLAELSPRYDGLFEVVPQQHINDVLETEGTRYRAVLSDLAGCANSGLLVQQVLAYLMSAYPTRFAYADCSPVTRVVVGDDHVLVEANGHRVSAERVVMCTNGFVDHEVVDAEGEPIAVSKEQQVTGRVAYMTAFVDEPRTAAAMSYIRNEVIGGDTAYVYVTRRTYDRPQDVVTLTCMGGPEFPTDDAPYDPDTPFPGPMLDAMDEQVRPFAQPKRPPSQPYDFQWHGLMGYQDGGVRIVGAHPEHPRLLYNLGCNGVGFLPSVVGGDRIARLLSGEQLGPSIFDPRV